MKWYGLTVACLCLTACGDPEQQFRLTATAEDGTPVAGASCKAWFTRNGEGDALRNRLVTAVTNREGIAELRGETLYYPSGIGAEMDGFYRSKAHKLWITGKSGNRWEPWPVEVELVMKKVTSPHPMYAVNAFDNFFFKILNLDTGKPLGFDLEVHDWVKPHGTGQVADFLISARRKDPSDTGFQPEGWVDVSFPNPADGILRLDDAGGSLLVGPVMAPESGYQDSWSFPNRVKRDLTAPPGRGAFVFRTRTALDEKGELTSARYGKLDGGISSSLYHERPSFTLTYYFNREPNDRRLEWDCKTNLIQGLENYYWPKRP